MFDQIGYYLINPQAVIYQTSTALLYPVLFAEVIALALTLFEAGRFTFEMLRRWRKRSLPRIDAAIAAAREALGAGKPDDAVVALRQIAHGRWVRPFFARLTDGDFTHVRLMKLLSDLEADVTRTLDRTRVLIRIGPMLGLMGTLIPISPALVALAQGDTQTLSDNLVIAFSTTVVGLLIGGFAYAMSMARDRVYALDVSDIEYVLDSLEV